MKVKELLKQLKGENPEMEIYLSSDSEGNAILHTDELYSVGGNLVLYPTDDFLEYEPVGLKTTEWKPYEEFGSYYRLLNGVLMCCPMLQNGDRDTDIESEGEVEYIEEQDKARIEEIKQELLNS